MTFLKVCQEATDLLEAAIGEDPRSSGLPQESVRLAAANCVGSVVPGLSKSSFSTFQIRDAALAFFLDSQKQYGTLANAIAALAARQRQSSPLSS